jgi:hypothetical protein
MITTCSNVAHKSDLGAGSTLRIFSKSRGELSLPDRVFGALYLLIQADPAIDLVEKVGDLV